MHPLVCAVDDEALLADSEASRSASMRATSLGIPTAIVICHLLVIIALTLAPDDGKETENSCGGESPHAYNKGVWLEKKVKHIGNLR